MDLGALALRRAEEQDRSESWRVEDSAEESGIYRYRITVEGNGEGKGTYSHNELGFYRITPPEHSYNAKMARIATVNQFSLGGNGHT